MSKEQTKDPTYNHFRGKLLLTLDMCMNFLSHFEDKYMNPVPIYGRLKYMALLVF